MPQYSDYTSDGVYALQLLSNSVRVRDESAAVMKRGRKRGKRVVPANPEGAPQVCFNAKYCSSAFFVGS